MAEEEGRARRRAQGLNRPCWRAFIGRASDWDARRGQAQKRASKEMPESDARSGSPVDMVCSVVMDARSSSPCARSPQSSKPTCSTHRRSGWWARNGSPRGRGWKSGWGCDVMRCGAVLCRRLFGGGGLRWMSAEIVVVRPLPPLLTEARCSALSGSHCAVSADCCYLLGVWLAKPDPAKLLVPSGTLKVSSEEGQWATQRAITKG